MSENRRPRLFSAGGMALAFLGFLAGGLAANLVGAHLSAWAAPILWLALLLAVLAALGFFAHRLPGWLAGAVVMFACSLSYFLFPALAFHAQLGMSINLVRALPFIGMLGFWVAVSAVTRRRRAQANTVTYDLSTDAPIGPPIPYMSERLMVYANEPLLQRRALLLAALTGGLVAGLRWVTVSHADSANFVLFGILLMLASIHLTLAVARLFMSGPTLVIGPEGITDNASLVATGSGLLRWDEISRVGHVIEKALAGITYHSLRIYLNNKALVRARQPLWKRLLGMFAGGFSPSWVTVYQGLLDESPETLAIHITQYAQSHARGSMNPPSDMAGNSGGIWGW